MKLDFALWTRDAVRQLIQQEAGFDMPIRTVGEYLKRWGFTPQKPTKFAYERKPEAVKNGSKKAFRRSASVQRLKRPRFIGEMKLV